MATIDRQLVQDDDLTERSILHTRLTQVNMRLFLSSPFYRQIILDAVSYIDAHISTIFDDYPNVRGVCAGALGINFNIIGFKFKGEKKKFCINPQIVRRSPDFTIVETKCGSIKSAKTIRVARNNLIDLEYYNLKGQNVVEKNIGRYEGGFTIQHEVEQSLGVTILDREVKDVVPAAMGQ